jgi:phage shock protein C
MQEPKKLYKSDTNKVLSGVCGGLGEYFNIDPTIVRAGYLFITLVSAFIPGIILYLVLLFVVPHRSYFK